MKNHGNGFYTIVLINISIKSNVRNASSLVYLFLFIMCLGYSQFTIDRYCLIHVDQRVGQCVTFGRIKVAGGGYKVGSTDITVEPHLYYHKREFELNTQL